MRPAILSPRQLDVLHGMSRGLTNKVIARELGLSHYTVKEYVSAIFLRTGMTSRRQATAELFRLAAEKTRA